MTESVVCTNRSYSSRFKPKPGEVRSPQNTRTLVCKYSKKCGKSRCNCSPRQRRNCASCTSRARTNRFRDAPCPSRRFAATCAPMYPVDPVKNIATWLHRSRFSRRLRLRVQVESCGEAAPPADGLQSEDRSSDEAPGCEC